jgi:multimeric flavodoxin WrbA
METGEGVSPSPMAIANGNLGMDMLITNHLPYVRAPSRGWAASPGSAHFSRVGANASSGSDGSVKIAAVVGSPRGMRSRTRRLASFVLAGAKEAGAEVDLIDLADLRITPCTACESCSLDGTCVFADDFSAAYDRMLDADGLVLASPVYVDNVSGQMKVFIDRLADAIHYQNFAGKYGCSLATTQVSGGDTVVGYLNHVLNYLGVTTVGGMSVALDDDAEALDRAEDAARDLGKQLALAVRDRPRYPDQEAKMAENRTYFAGIVRTNRDWRPDEYERWVRKGWIREE